MITLAETHQTTAAKPADIFKLWADINHWAEYDEGIEWAKLTDTFAAGGHYLIYLSRRVAQKLKPLFLLSKQIVVL